MEFLIAILVLLCGLTSLGCWIFTIVRLFTNDAIVHGIIGIFCALWAFIMGWKMSDEMNHKPVMVAWSIAFILGLIGQIGLAAIAPAMQ